MAGKVKNIESWQLIYNCKWTNYVKLQQFQNNPLDLVFTKFDSIKLWNGIFLKRVKQNKFDKYSTTNLCTASLLENMKTCYALFQEMKDTGLL